MSTVPTRAPACQQMVLRDITWREYSRLLDVFAEKPRLRLTYDRGSLEIMSPLIEHEGDADLFGQLVVVLTEELNLPRKAGGSTTLRRRRSRRGLEPDRCFWISSEPQVRGKKRLDLRVDPPPDLASEVDVTSSSLDRMTIYPALGVPEVWRLAGGTLTFQVLASGTCTTEAASRSFPLISPTDLLGFLGQAAIVGEAQVLVLFRTWLRQRIAMP